MSDNSNYRPIPGLTPLKLPPKPEPVAPPAPPSEMLPPLDETESEPASASVPVATKPVIAPAINKLPAAPKFVSPMPKIEESDSDIPAFLPVVAGIAVAVTLAFTVLIYLKR